MGQNLPRVTVLIANYNYADSVGTAIESAFNQTFQCNICVVDDCSTDNSQEVIAKCLGVKGASKEVDENGNIIQTIVSRGIPQQKIKFIKLAKNSGPSEARNVGIEATKDFTDFYVILDADDAMYEKKTEVMLKYACVNPNQIAVVYADYDILNTETGNIIREYKEPFSIKRLMKECIVHSGSMINARMLEDVKDENGYYDREMRTCEDYDLWIRLSRKFMFLHVPESLTLVSNHPQNSTMTVDKKVWQNNWNRISNKIRKVNEQQIHSSH